MVPVSCRGPCLPCAPGRRDGLAVGPEGFTPRCRYSQQRLGVEEGKHQATAARRLGGPLELAIRGSDDWLDFLKTTINGLAIGNMWLPVPAILDPSD